MCLLLPCSLLHHADSLPKTVHDGDAHFAFRAMSAEQLRQFLEVVHGDAALQEKLREVRDKDAAVKIAKASGFSITTEDIDQHQAQSSVSFDDLEMAQGGVSGPGIHSAHPHYDLWDSAHKLFPALGKDHPVALSYYDQNPGDKPTDRKDRLGY